MAMLLFSLEQIKAEDDPTPQDPQTMTYLNGKLWVSVFFLLFALVAAYKIAADNVPDTEKDSILYAKFLQGAREKRHGE